MRITACVASNTPRFSYGNARSSNIRMATGCRKKGFEMTKLSNGVTSVGAATAGFGWLTTTEMAAIFGALMAACGFIVTLVYTVRRDKRDREVHQVKVEAFQSLCEERSIEDVSKTLNKGL